MKTHVKFKMLCQNVTKFQENSWSFCLNKEIIHVLKRKMTSKKVVNAFMRLKSDLNTYNRFITQMKGSREC